MAYIVGNFGYILLRDGTVCCFLILLKMVSRKKRIPSKISKEPLLFEKIEFTLRRNHCRVEGGWENYINVLIHRTDSIY